MWVIFGQNQEFVFQTKDIILISTLKSMQISAHRLSKLTGQASLPMPTWTLLFSWQLTKLMYSPAPISLLLNSCSCKCMIYSNCTHTHIYIDSLSTLLSTQTLWNQTSFYKQQYSFSMQFFFSIFFSFHGWIVSMELYHWLQIDFNWFCNRFCNFYRHMDGQIDRQMDRMMDRQNNE